MNDARKWIRIARSEDIPLREGRSVRLGGREIAIFNLGDRFLAISNHCPHKNGPLCEGIVSGCAVVCPLHAWKVDLESGAVTRPTESRDRVETFPVRVEAGVVLVEVPVESPRKKEMPGVCAEHVRMAEVLNPPRLGMKDSEVGTLGA